MAHDPEEHTMTFWEHLDELRSRLIRAAIAFTGGCVVAWIYREELLLWLVTPFMNAWNAQHLAGRAALHFPAPASLFVAYVKLALLGGLVIAFPIILYQIWAFVAPGLYSREKRLAIPFVVVSCALFLAGGYYGWRLAFPIAFQYLLGFSGPVGIGDFEVTPTVMIGDYLDFVTYMLLGFGAGFELPVLIFFLSLAGVVTHKQLIRFFRYFVVIAFVAGAMLTPPDILSQVILAIPLCLLYGISIGLAWLIERSRRKRAA
jgi:sec-independent protein translocase protein TatC